MSIWHQLWNEPDAKVIARGLDEANTAEKLAAESHSAREGLHRRHRSLLQQLREARPRRPRQSLLRRDEEGLRSRYPDDHEAATFYALSLLASEPHNDATFANRKAAAAILEKLFATEPDHPGVAHYLIHAYDKPQLAQLGIPAARRYAQVAPAAPHALHMPSHIFARVGLWQDDINSNLASIAATRKTAAMDMGGEGHQFHAMDFLFYAYLQSGREAEPAELMDEVKAMPEMHDMYGVGFDPHLPREAHFAALYPTRDAGLGSRCRADAGGSPGTAERLRSPIGPRRSAPRSFASRRKSAKMSHAIEAIHQKFVADKKKDFAEAHRERSEAGPSLAGVRRRQVRRSRRSSASHRRQRRRHWATSPRASPPAK